jgi:hypothetical protein
MISRGDVATELGLKHLPHYNSWVGIEPWMKTGKGFATLSLSPTDAGWQTYMRRFDRIFFPEDAIMGFCVVALGHGASVKLTRIKLPGVLWKLGMQK